MAVFGKRTLIGCGIGCGGLIILGIVLIVSFNVWLNRPGDLLEPEKLLGSDTTGYLEWRLRLEDPGTEGFVRKMIDAAQTLPPDARNEMPGWMADWLQGRQKKEAEKDIMAMLPMVIAWTLRPDEEADDDLHLVTVSVEQFGNRLVFGDWILGFILSRIPEARVIPYGKEKIYQLPIDEKDDEKFVTFFIRHGNVFFASDADTARQAVERLSTPEPQTTPETGLEQLFVDTARGTLRGALTNSRGELARLWRLFPLAADEDLGSDETWKDVRGLTLAGGLQSDGSFAATIELSGPDSGWANEFAEPVGRVLRESLSGIDHPVDLTSTAYGDRVRVDLRLEDLSAILENWVVHGIEIDDDDGKGTVRIDF